MTKTHALRRPLLLPLALIACLPGTAWADDDAASGDDRADASADELVVQSSPIRESLAASLAIQRDAENVVNAITSDDAGRFPDQTVAGALSRLPAVAVQRDQGQERYVQVRGAPTRWTVVSFDGLNVLGAEERIFRFDSVPAALISTVELNKTLLPDMPAEALAGRVNIKTFSALDNPGFHALVDGGYGFVDLGDGPQEQISARGSWGNDTFGVVVAGSHYQFEQQTDNAEPRYDATGLNNLRNAKYIIVRETNSLSGKLEFSPAPDQWVSATSLYTEFLDHEQRNQYTFNFAGLSGTRTATEGSVAAVPIQGAFERGEYKNSTWINMLQGEHGFGAFRAGWTAAYVETESLTDLPIISQTATDAALRPDISYMTGKYNLPVLSLSDVAGPRTALNQQAFDRETLTLFRLGSKTKSYTGKLDLAYDWSAFGADATLSVGGQYDDRSSKDPGQAALIRPDGTSGSLLLRDVAAELGMPWTPIALVTPTPFDEALDRGYTANYLNNVAIRDQLYVLLDAATDANAAGANYPVPARNPALANTVNEEIIAGYVSNLWKRDRFSVLAGVRVERTRISSVGAATVAGALVPVDISSKKTFFFPSVHLNYDATEDLKLRASIVSGAARPSFVDQRATVTISDGLAMVTGGNPSLKPERAVGGDASIEWYFAPASLLSASGFYRKVKDTLFDATTLVGDARFNFNGVDRSGYTFTTTRNGDDGELYGIEFAYDQPFTFLPGALSGFGVQASIAFVDGTFETPDGRRVAFPGTSDRITNLSVFYEKYGLSARVSYQHRTDWLDDISVDATRDLYWNATERVDLSVRFQFLENLAFYADVINLTDEPGIRYEGDASRPYEVEQFGRRFLFGVRATL